jgi:hypothetical protein
MTKDQYVATIRQAFVTMGREAAMNFLVSKLPIFANRFLNPFAGWLVGIIVEGIAVRGETAAFFYYIDMRVGAQAKDFETAAIENLKAQQTGDDNAKQKAEANLKKAFREFVVLSN